MYLHWVSQKTMTEHTSDDRNFNKNQQIIIDGIQRDNDNMFMRGIDNIRQLWGDTNTAAGEVIEALVHGAVMKNIKGMDEYAYVIEYIYSLQGTDPNWTTRLYDACYDKKNKVKLHVIGRAIGCAIDGMAIGSNEDKLKHFFDIYQNGIDEIDDYNLRVVLGCGLNCLKATERQ